MNQQTHTSAPDRTCSRRDFVKKAGALSAGAALAGVAIPHVHGAEDNTIRLALIGSGGRGSGAVGNALEAPAGPVKLCAMADIFEYRLSKAYQALSARYGDRIDVPSERRFLGFDAYQKAIDCLRPGDVALLTTHAAFRPTHLDYAVEKGVHVFMEKSFAPDLAGLHQMLRAGEAAEVKNLKIATGLMCRHSVARQGLIDKVRDGQMGDLQLIRAYRLDSGGVLRPRDRNSNELLWQIGQPGAPHFLWVSSGWYIDWLIHQIDECCWLKDDWPVAAHGLGGRMPDSTDCGQNFDNFSVEYTFADGAKALVSGRRIPHCHNEFATYAHGSRCAAQFSGSGHKGTVHLFKGQRIDKADIEWSAAAEKHSPWEAEWHVLLDAIRNDRPHNETRRSVYSNVAAIMGRAAVHSGQAVTWDDAMNSRFEFCSHVDRFGYDSPAPIHDNAEGRYPVPIPGVWSEI